MELPDRRVSHLNSGFPGCPLTRSVEDPHPVDPNVHHSTPPNPFQEKTQNPK